MQGAIYRHIRKCKWELNFVLDVIFLEIPFSLSITICLLLYFFLVTLSRIFSKSSISLIFSCLFFSLSSFSFFPLHLPLLHYLYLSPKFASMNRERCTSVRFVPTPISEPNRNHYRYHYHYHYHYYHYHYHYH